MGIINRLRKSEGNKANQLEEPSFQIVLKRVRDDLKECMGMKSAIDEAGYADDEEMEEAFQKIRLASEDLASEVYTAAAYGIDKTIGQLKHQRDGQIALEPEDFPLSGYITMVRDEDSIAESRKRGYSKLVLREHGRHLYERNEQEKEVYTKRIRTLKLLQISIEEGVGSLEDIENRVIEIETGVSGYLQAVRGLRSLIEEGRDRISLAERESISKFFEPAEY